jgi:hypothetical protein
VGVGIPQPALRGAGAGKECTVALVLPLAGCRGLAGAARVDRQGMVQWDGQCPWP